MTDTKPLNILIPSFRSWEFLGRLLGTIKLKVKVPYRIHIVRNIPRKHEAAILEFDKIMSPDVTVTWYNASDLSLVYKMLYDKVPVGEKFWYLEDDDYLIDSLEPLNLWGDITLLNYKSKVAPIDAYQWTKVLQEFPIMGYDYIDSIERQFGPFQISCFIGTKKEIVFPTGNDIKNDFLLFREFYTCVTKTTLKMTPVFMQTADAGNNISFEEFNTDERFKSTHRTGS